MKRIIPAFALLFVVFAPTAAAQPTSAQEVFQAHVDAAGGADAWMAVERSYASGEVSLALPTGIASMDMEVWTVYPDVQLREITMTQSIQGMPDLSSTQFISPEEGFIENFQGRMDISMLGPEAETMLRAQAEHAMEELAFLADDSLEVTLLEQTQVNNTLVNVVEIGGATPIKRFYHAETGLLFGFEAPNPMGGVARTFVTDYRDIDGLKVAFKNSTDLGQFQQNLILDSIEFNGDFTADDVLARLPSEDE